MGPGDVLLRDCRDTLASSVDLFYHLNFYCNKNLLLWGDLT